MRGNASSGRCPARVHVPVSGPVQLQPSQLRHGRHERVDKPGNIFILIDQIRIPVGRRAIGARKQPTAGIAGHHLLRKAHTLLVAVCQEGARFSVQGLIDARLRQLRFGLTQSKGEYGDTRVQVWTALPHSVVAPAICQGVNDALDE